MESQAFTIVATQCQTEHYLKVFSDDGEDGASSHMSQTGGGFAAIYGPDGRKLTKDIAPDWEGILYADLDMSDIAFAKSVADPVGHYSRPDLFTLVVDDHRKEHVVYSGTDGPKGHSTMLHRIPSLDEVTKTIANTSTNVVLPKINGVTSKSSLPTTNGVHVVL